MTGFPSVTADTQIHDSPGCCGGWACCSPGSQVLYIINTSKQGGEEEKSSSCFSRIFGCCSGRSSSPDQRPITKEEVRIGLIQLYGEVAADFALQDLDDKARRFWGPREVRKLEKSAESLQSNLPAIFEVHHQLVAKKRIEKEVQTFMGSEPLKPEESLRTILQKSISATITSNTPPTENGKDVLSLVEESLQEGIPVVTEEGLKTLTDAYCRYLLFSIRFDRQISPDMCQGIIKEVRKDVNEIKLAQIFQEELKQLIIFRVFTLTGAKPLLTPPKNLEKVMSRKPDVYSTIADKEISKLTVSELKALNDLVLQTKTKKD